MWYCTVHSRLQMALPYLLESTVFLLIFQAIEEFNFDLTLHIGMFDTCQQQGGKISHKPYMSISMMQHTCCYKATCVLGVVFSQSRSLVTACNPVKVL